MANQHMKNMLNILVIRDMQIKITMRYYFTPTRMGILNKTVTNVDENVQNCNPHTLLSENVKWYSHFRK